MATTTLTLTEFLLARIAEDEASARDLAADAMVGAPWKHFPKDAYDQIQSMALTLAHRTKVEAQAKRRIMALDYFGDPGDDYTLGQEVAHGDVLRILALPYADHKDYREEWKP